MYQFKAMKSPRKASRSKQSALVVLVMISNPYLRVQNIDNISLRSIYYLIMYNFLMIKTKKVNQTKPKQKEFDPVAIIHKSLYNDNFQLKEQLTKYLVVKSVINIIFEYTNDIL